MKKFYEAPVVELTGFSAEDVITTSATEPGKIDAADAANTAAFTKAVADMYTAGDTSRVQVYNW